MSDKQVIAVIFGGRSVEHDVSVLTGLQCMEALDPALYIGLPVYIDTLGQWWTGDALKNRNNYPQNTASNDLVRIELDLAAANAIGRPQFTTYKKGMMGLKAETIPFDFAIPAIHGSNGEDGTLAGLLDFASIPYAGCRALGAAATMDKAFAKSVARQKGINVLDECLFDRPADGAFLDEKETENNLIAKLGASPFPVIVKPVNLGSSVGVSKADDIDGLIAALMNVFQMDAQAIVEPFVPNLVEYNVAVRRLESGDITTSAIERPLSSTDVLDFKNKYLAGGDPGAPKLDTGPSEGMASLNRILNPEELTAKQEDQIRDSATQIFGALDLAGSVRIDFLCDSKTGALWLNEVNTIPGSFAYFLWEAAEDPISFLKLTDAMIREGMVKSKNRLGNTSASSGGASIFVG